MTLGGQYEASQRTEPRGTVSPPSLWGVLKIAEDCAVRREKRPVFAREVFFSLSLLALVSS